MRNYSFNSQKGNVLDIISQYIDINTVPIGKPKQITIDVETPKSNGTNIYFASVFEKGEITNERIGIYIVLLNKGDTVSFYDYNEKRAQALYVIINGHGEYIGSSINKKTVRRSFLEKGNITSNQGDSGSSGITNIGDEPLVIFMVTTKEIMV